MVRTFLRWDVFSKIALALCLVPPALPFLTGTPVEEASQGEWVVMLLASLSAVPLMSAPQIAFIFLIRLAPSRGLKALFLAASIGSAAVFLWFLRSADLTSTSTAPMAALVFPLYLGAGVIAAGGILLWLHRKVTRDRSRSG